MNCRCPEFRLTEGVPDMRERLRTYGHSQDLVVVGVLCNG